MMPRNEKLIAELRTLAQKLDQAERRLNEHVFHHGAAPISIPADPEHDADIIMLDAADAMRRAAVALADCGWRTIETALKDGRPCLIGGYSKEEQVWRSAVCLWATGGEFWWDWPWGIKPTHWCDTPPPPAKDEG